MGDLSNIKAGDFVAVTTYYSRTPNKREVARVTATQVIISDSLRFMKSTGRAVGTAMDRTYAAPWTDAHDQRIADDARVAEQRVAIEAMMKDFDRAVWDARQLRHRDRPIADDALEGLRSALAQAATLVSEAVKAVG